MMTSTKVTVREGRADSSALSDQSLALPGDWKKVQAQKAASNFLIPVGTAWVERDVLGVSEEIYKLSGGRCRVASCNCGRCLDKGHFPHVVVELGKDGRTYPVFGFRKFGPHVVQRMLEIHVSQKHNAKAMKHNEKLRETKKQAAKDLQRERLEVVQSALSSHKFDWRGPNGMRTKAL